MSIRRLAFLTAFFAIVFPASLLAQVPGPVPEMQRLHLLLSIINAEIKSDLDQVLMLQEALKVNGRASLEAQGRSPDPISVEDMAESQRRAIERETTINARLNEILARGVILDAKKQRLLERVHELGMTR